MKLKSKMSLAEQISALNDPAPSYDPEDASDTETKAKLAEFEEDSEDVSEVKPSQLRRRAAGVLADEDQRYAGQTSTRKNLELWDDDDVEFSAENENDIVDSDDDDDAIDSSDDQMSPESDDDTSEEDDQSDISDEKRRMRTIEDAFKKIRGELDEEASDDDDDDDDDNDDDNEYDDFDDDIDSDDDDADESEDADEDHHGNEEAPTGVQAFAAVSLDEEVAKGKATKAQLILWDTLVENRIKLQKALAIANQLPAYDKQAAFLQTGGQAVQEMQHSSSQQLKSLLKKLVDLQQALLLGNQATRHIVEGIDVSKHDSDEEIPSSDEDEVASSSPGRSRKRPTDQRRKRKADTGDLGDFLAKRHKDFESFQYDTIQKWHDKTRLATGKSSAKSFSSFEKSAVTQIHQVLQDKRRLIKRTQLRRTVYTRLGDTQENGDDATNTAEVTQDVTVPGNAHLKDYDEETFDDDDFYHQLLRELIEKRTSSTTDPVQLTRQWLEVQKLRRKIKKKVDTKASKGRKIRYDVHPKLVSFMAGRDMGAMMDSAKSELFSSLFGKRRNPTDVS